MKARSHSGRRHVLAACLALITATGSVAQLTSVATVTSDPPSHSAGGAVASIGDLNGDGIREVIIPAFGNPDLFAVGPPANPYPSGTQTPPVVVHSGQTGAPIRSLLPTATATSRFGSAVASIADVNQDGAPDIIVGDPWDSAFGRVHVYSGATGALLWHVGGSVVGMRQFGIAVAGSSDLDGDGTPDVVVGAAGHLGGGTYQGAAYALSGSSGAVIRTWISLTPDAHFGEAVASLGDTNGDGVSDVAVGMPGISGSTISAGAVFVYSGATGALLRTFTGMSLLERYGCAVAAAGDLDADGNADICIGAPRAPAGANQGRMEARSVATGGLIWGLAGAATSVDKLGASLASLGDLNFDGVPDVAVGLPGQGQLGGAVRTVSGANGSTIGTFTGTIAASVTGVAVAGAGGDLNGDGVPDLIVGDGLTPDSGRVYVVSGAGYSVIFQVSGDSGSASFGASVAAAGNLDADGIPDFVVGAPLRNGKSLPDSGLVQAYSGATLTMLFQAEGSLPFERLGWCVATAGDVNGDGTPDVLAGAPANAQNVNGAGRAFVFSGANGATLLTVSGPALGSQFGYSVVSLGDLTADGVPDFAVGAPFAPPAASGSVSVFSGANGALIGFFIGQPGDFFGTCVARIGDLDGDGLSELAIGAPRIGPTNVPAGGTIQLIAPPAVPGYVSVYSGAGGLLFTIPGTPADGAFGFSIADIGDVDNSGYRDILVGTPGSISNSGRVFDGNSGALLYLVPPSVPGDHGGWSVAALQDVSGDSIPDFVIGHPRFTWPPVPLPTLPHVQVHSGANGALLFTQGTVLNNNFGASVAGIGDLTGDGVTEMLVSEPGLNQVHVLTTAALPPAVAFFGTGCSVPGPFSIPPTIGTNGSPSIGNAAFAVTVSGAGTPAGVAAGLIAGPNNSSWNGTPLPMALAPLGLGAGCSLLVSADLFFNTTTSTAPAAGSIAFPIPLLPGIQGYQAYFQWYVASPLPGVFGGLSQGMRLTVQ